MKTLSNSGYSLVFVSITMIFILGMTALVIDIGLTIYEKQKLEDAIDAATLAGMQDIDKDDISVINSAKQYASLNSVDPSTLNISISSDRKGISIQSNKIVKYFFARAVGINSAIVNTKSKAKVVPVTSYNGARPFAVINQTLVFGQQCTLKEDAGNGLAGNYGALALGGNGASVYKDNLLYGFKTTLNVGDSVYTETGNISGATQQAIESIISLDSSSTYTTFQKGSPRFIVIPIVNTLDLNGKKPITIVGFAGFFLEGTQNDGGHTSVVGRFIRNDVSGNGSDTQTDYGLRTTKLTN